MPNSLEGYVRNAPSKQAVLDLFDGEWSSAMPAETGLIARPGTAGLFEDPRIAWGEQVFGSFEGFDVLELGPLEGGHSYMLQKRGARSVVAVEANVRAYMKCLCIKELFHLDRVSFELGDFMPFLESTTSKYDLVLASGVLYHMQQPIDLIRLISGVSNRALIWTHYFDETLVRSRPDLAPRFGPIQILDDQYEYSSQLYLDARTSPAFCGGPEQASKWLTRESILRALWQSGFRHTELAFEDPSHPNGPAFAVCASK